MADAEGFKPMNALLKTVSIHRKSQSCANYHLTSICFAYDDAFLF